eukprot:Pgem_evm1s2103
MQFFQVLTALASSTSIAQASLISPPQSVPADPSLKSQASLISPPRSVPADPSLKSQCNQKDTDKYGRAVSKCMKYVRMTLTSNSCEYYTKTYECQKANKCFAKKLIALNEKTYKDALRRLGPCCGVCSKDPRHHSGTGSVIGNGATAAMLSGMVGFMAIA